MHGRKNIKFYHCQLSCCLILLVILCSCVCLYSLLYCLPFVQLPLCCNRTLMKCYFCYHCRYFRLYYSANKNPYTRNFGDTMSHSRSTFTLVPLDWHTKFQNPVQEGHYTLRHFQFRAANCRHLVSCSRQSAVCCSSNHFPQRKLQPVPLHPQPLFSFSNSHVKWRLASLKGPHHTKHFAPNLVITHLVQKSDWQDARTHARTHCMLIP